jgi:hypothetical protein
MIAQMDPRRLPRLDSPNRIAWLRAQLRGYTVDLAARAYFRLPTTCDDKPVPCPRSEALEAFGNLASGHGLTVDECLAGFNAEWSAGLRLAEQAGEKLKIAALSHIKVNKSSAGLEQVLRQTCRRFPDAWPFLTDADINAIAAGFQRPQQRRRSA